MFASLARSALLLRQYFKRDRKIVGHRDHQADFVVQKIIRLAGIEHQRANDRPVPHERKGRVCAQAVLQGGLAPGLHPRGGADVVAKIGRARAQRRAHGALAQGAAVRGDHARGLKEIFPAGTGGGDWSRPASVGV
jgi:hypothetical protein